MHSVLAIVRGGMSQGIGVDVVTIGNCSLVPLARNSMISYFYQQEKYTHIFFLDADMMIPNDTLPKLLKHNVPIVGAAVSLKGEMADGRPPLNIGAIINRKSDTLITVEHLGGAIVLIDRKATTLLCEASEKYFVDPEFSRGDSLVTEAYDVFSSGPQDGNYWPEDYAMCRKARRLGLDIHVDLSIANIHNGNYKFENGANNERIN